VLKPETTAAAEETQAPRSVTISEFPVVQHRHRDGTIVTVRLRRVAGEYKSFCTGCNTEFVYRKPRQSRMVHHKSPLLPEIQGNYDDPEHDRL
jgi:hypothetical protein